MRFSWEKTLDAFLEFYQMDLNGQINGSDNFSSNPIVQGYFSNSQNIMKIFSDSGIEMGNLDPVARSILRTFISMVILGEDIPLAISRSIRISDKFSSKHMSKFIHAVVSKVVRNLPKNSSNF